VINLNLIKQKRRLRRISQAKIAKDLSVATITYQQYENGLRTFPEDLLKKTCEIIGLDYLSVVSSPVSTNDPIYILALQIRELDPEAIKAIQTLVEKLKNK
jgi:transcriptional regulator with XRE-family HTH domain